MSKQTDVPFNLGETRITFEPLCAICTVTSIMTFEEIRWNPGWRKLNSEHPGANEKHPHSCEETGDFIVIRSRS